MVILLMARIALVPDKMREPPRELGNVMGELRQASAGVPEERRTPANDATAKAVCAEVARRKSEPRDANPYDGSGDGTEVDPARDAAPA